MARKRQSTELGLPRRSPQRAKAGNDWLFPSLAAESGLEESSLLDVIDNVLNLGVVLQGDVVLGVANVDLIYVKLSLLLAAMDRVQGDASPMHGSPARGLTRSKRGLTPSRNKGVRPVASRKRK